MAPHSRSRGQVFEPFWMQLSSGGSRDTGMSSRPVRRRRAHIPRPPRRELPEGVSQGSAVESVVLLFLGHLCSSKRSRSLQRVYRRCRHPPIPSRFPSSGTDRVGCERRDLRTCQLPATAPGLGVGSGVRGADERPEAADVLIEVADLPYDGLGRADECELVEPPLRREGLGAGVRTGQQLGDPDRFQDRDVYAPIFASEPFNASSRASSVSATNQSRTMRQSARDGAVA